MRHLLARLSYRRCYRGCGAVIYRRYLACPDCFMAVPEHLRAEYMRALGRRRGDRARLRAARRNLIDWMVIHAAKPDETVREGRHRG